MQRLHATVDFVPIRISATVTTLDGNGVEENRRLLTAERCRMIGWHSTESVKDLAEVAYEEFAEGLHVDA